MTRLSIINRFCSISYEQCIKMLQAYKLLVEGSYGTACTYDIRAMNQIKMTSSKMHDDYTMDFMAKCNENSVFFKTSDLFAFPKEVFQQAVYIEVAIIPTDRLVAPPYAFAQVEFKGSRPRQATFYMQPDGAVVHENLKKRFRFQKFGDGYSFNTDHL